MEGDFDVEEESKQLEWVLHTDGYWYKKYEDGSFDPVAYILDTDGNKIPFNEILPLKPEVVVVTKTDNTTLWNVVIIASILVILLYPSGIFELNMLDRASVNCEAFVDDDLDEDGVLYDKCQKIKLDNSVYIVFTLISGLIALSINNKKTGSKSGIDSQLGKDNSTKSKKKIISKKERESRNKLVINLILIPIIGIILTSSIDLNPEKFTCDNGDIIDSEFVGDIIVDCKDGSDEEGLDNYWILKDNLSRIVPLLLLGLTLLYLVNKSGIKSDSSKKGSSSEGESE